MTKVVAAKVTPQGVLVPRPLIAAWGDIQEVEIEQHADVIVIKPKTNRASQLHAQIVSEMKAAGNARPCCERITEGTKGQGNRG